MEMVYLRVGIDARPLSINVTGVGLNIINLVNYLTTQDDIECVLFSDKDLKYKFSSDLKIKIIIFSARRRFIWEQLYLPKHIFQQRIDLYHATWNYGIPVRLNCPALLTIHDLIPLILPGYFSSLKEKLIYKSVYLASIIFSAHKAKKIIADSENSKNDIVRLLKVARKKIEVIPIGFNPIYRPIKDARLIEECKIKYGIKGDYIIYVGGFDNRKNIGGLLKAFRLLKDLVRDDLQLVITGEWNFLYPKTKQVALELQIENDTIFTDYVPDEDMPILISGAKMLVYPSFYEGFGLPPLEAMACGTPVITSNVSSLPEVVGDAGILIDPYSIDEITQAMLKLLKDNLLRERLIKKGLERSTNFSWQENARKTLAIYREVIRF